ncbi:MAG: helix-turn-helix domain-containing protein [Proteobacteria bacterium]|nr:helix-turn-helix domain-containing protein [Pseudomonadota bacterium]
MAKTLRSARHSRLLKFLISARKEAGLTQQELAKRLSKPQSFVAKVEKGERRLDIIEFLDLAVALGVDPSRAIRRLEKAKETA